MIRKRVQRDEGKPAKVVDDVPELDGIYAKHAWIVANRSPLQATGKNSAQNYAYADTADILAAIMPFVKQMGLSLRLSEVDSKVDFHPHWDEEDGKWKFLVSATVAAEAILVDPSTNEEIRTRASNHSVDWNGDKATSKALTGAYKYCLRYLFLLATGEDSEDDAHDIANKGSGSKRSKSRSSDDDLL